MAAFILDGNTMLRLPWVFEVKQSNGDEVITVQHKGYLKIQDGGRQTGNTYNSVSRR